jgi:hypothetical protein
LEENYFWMKTYSLRGVRVGWSILLLSLIIAVRVGAVEPAEIVGTWRNQWGAVTELRSDYTYKSGFADEFGTGTWRLNKEVLLTLQSYSAYWQKRRVIHIGSSASRRTRCV